MEAKEISKAKLSSFDAVKETVVLNNNEIKILSAPTVQAAYGFPAIPIDDQQKYIVSIRHKSSVASTSNLFLRLEQYNASLLVGKTHLSLVAAVSYT